jgi:hypothetical protein
MLESEVLNKILDDFTSSNPDMATEQLKTFCQYAATWLASRGVVGVGHTVDGMSLRFADGQELLLLSPPEVTKSPALSDAVGITGNAAKITKPVIDSPSFNITGRQ